jgi:hypothetical protein
MATLGELLWGTAGRRAVTAVTLIGTTATAVVAVPAAWDAMGLPEVAMRSYVAPRFAHIELAQADTTRAVYLLSLAQLQSSLYAAQQDATKSPSQTVTERIQQLQQQIEQVQGKINTTK